VTTLRVGLGIGLLVSFVTGNMGWLSALGLLVLLVGSQFVPHKKKFTDKEWNDTMGRPLVFILTITVIVMGLLGGFVMFLVALAMSVLVYKVASVHYRIKEE